jgi:hypothetical protein
MRPVCFIPQIPSTKLELKNINFSGAHYFLVLTMVENADKLYTSIKQKDVTIVRPLVDVRMSQTLDDLHL